MEIKDVDVEKMCAGTCGYLTPGVVERAFRAIHVEDDVLEISLRHQFHHSTLAQVVEAFGQTTLAAGGSNERAFIRVMAHFFPSRLY